MISTFRANDRVMVKLSDADWLPAVVLSRNVTGFGTPAYRVTYDVCVNALVVCDIPSDKIKDPS